MICFMVWCVLMVVVCGGSKAVGECEGAVFVAEGEAA